MKKTSLYRGTPFRSDVPRMAQLGIDAGIARARRDAFLSAARATDSPAARHSFTLIARNEHKHFLLFMRFIRLRIARGEG